MKTLEFDVMFGIGDVVYLRIRQEKVAGMVTGFNFRPDGIGYYITWEDASERMHYAFELSSEYVPEYSEPPVP